MLSRRETLARDPGFVETCEWTSYSLVAFIRQVGSAPEIQAAADKIEEYGICGRTLKEEFYDNDNDLKKTSTNTTYVSSSGSLRRQTIQT